MEMDKLVIWTLVLLFAGALYWLVYKLFTNRPDDKRK